MQEKSDSKRAVRVFRGCGLALISLLATSCLFWGGDFHERSLDSFGFRAADNPSLRIDHPALFIDSSYRIDITIPTNADPASMAAAFSFKGVKVLVNGREQTSGVTKNDFTKPVTYQVLGLDDKTTDYVVSARIVAPSGAKSLSLDIGNVNQIHYGYSQGSNSPLPLYYFYDAMKCANKPTWTVDYPNWNYNFRYNSAVDLSSMYASFRTDGIRVSVGDKVLVPGLSFTDPWTSINVLDCTNPVTFVVTAEDDSTASYVATFTRHPIMESFSFKNASNPTMIDRSGVIDDTSATINIDVPSTIARTSLVAEFAIQGEALAVGQNAQTSGASANDFSTDVTYTVKGLAGNDRSYRVHANPVPPSSLASLIDITIGSVNLSYSSYEKVNFYTWSTEMRGLISVFPRWASIDLAQLYVGPSIGGIRIEVVDKAGRREIHHDTWRYYVSNYVDFTGPVKFIVTAEDGSTVEYFPNITQAAQ
jgi:hypothetical protein